MKQAIFGIVVVAVVCAVFVLSQSKLDESSVAHSPTETAIESNAQSHKESNEEGVQEQDSIQPHETALESSSTSNVESPKHSSNATLDSKPSTTQDLESNQSAKTFVVCADNAVVYDDSGRHIIGSALKGLKGEEVRRVGDKVVLQIKGYHRGTQILYADSVFGDPMLELHGLDSQMSLEVAIAQKDLSENANKPCEMQEPQSQHTQSQTPNLQDSQHRRVQSYGSI